MNISVQQRGFFISYLQKLLILLCLHDYLEVVATLQYHVLQEVRNLLGSYRLHHLTVVGVGIYLTQIIHAQNLHPVAVGLLVNTSLLQQNLLHLLQVVGIRSSNRLLHTLEEARNSCIYLIRVQLSRTVDGKRQLAVVSKIKPQDAPVL